MTANCLTYILLHKRNTILPDLLSSGMSAVEATGEKTCELVVHGVDVDIRLAEVCFSKSGHSGFGVDVCIWSEIVAEFQGGSLEWLQLAQKDELGSLKDLMI